MLGFSYYFNNQWTFVLKTTSHIKLNRATFTVDYNINTFIVHSALGNICLVCANFILPKKCNIYRYVDRNVVNFVLTACNCAYMSWISNLQLHTVSKWKKKIFLKHKRTRANKLHQRTEMVCITRWLTPEPSYILCVPHVAPSIKIPPKWRDYM